MEKSEVRPVLLFDSGIGGLSVLKAIREILPELPVIYAADDAAFPYGAWEEGALIAHIVGLMGELIARFEPRAVVIACNTASTLVMPALREQFSVPFVGTVPAVKPAAEQTESGVVAVLATPGTMQRDYTRHLIQQFAQNCHVRLVGAPELAGLAEALLRGEAIDPEAVRTQIAPCFLEIDGRRTDIVVLGCTHYPFLIAEMDKVAAWPVRWLDPAPAIARRLRSVLGEGTREGNGEGDGESLALFTSGRDPSPKLAEVLDGFGLRTVVHA